MDGLTWSKSFFSAVLDNLGVTVDDLLSGAPGPLRRQDGPGLGADLEYVPYFSAVTERGGSNLVKISFSSELLDNLGYTVDELLAGHQ